jgi:hypothetical protein
VKARKQVPLATSYVQPAGQGFAVTTCVLRASEPTIKRKEIKHDLPKDAFFNMEKVWKRVFNYA